MVILGVILALLGLAAAAALGTLVQGAAVRGGSIEASFAGLPLQTMTAGGFALRAAILGALAVTFILVGIELVLFARRRIRGHTLRALSTTNAGLEARNRLLEQRAHRLEKEVDELVAWHESALEEARKLGYEAPARRLPARPKSLLVVPDLEAAEAAVPERPAKRPE